MTRLGLHRLAGVHRRLQREDGFTLTELIVTMSIMLVVISSLVTLFTSGANAENQLNLRFQAQSQGRVALDRFRREVHNSCRVTVVAPTSIQLWTINAADRDFRCTSQSATWCTTGSGQRWALYRHDGFVGTCGSGGALWADYIVTASGAVFPGLAQGTGQLPRVLIDMTINRTPSVTVLNYRLDDAIALRNFGRTS